MRDNPDTSDLLRLAHDALTRHVLPELTGGARYQALMALNALSIATRQVEAGVSGRTAALAALRQVTPAESLDAANAALAGEIRAGRTSAELYAALLAVTRLAVAESNPQARALKPDPETGSHGS